MIQEHSSGSRPTLYIRDSWLGCGGARADFAASETAAGSKRTHRRLTPGGEPYMQTAPVGSFAPNALGLYDMAGNVWQWCADNYKKNGALRRWGVLRGGSWADYGPNILQSSYRNVVPSDERDVIYGFRCVLDLGDVNPVRKLPSG